DPIEHSGSDKETVVTRAVLEQSLQPNPHTLTEEPEVSADQQFAVGLACHGLNGSVDRPIRIKALIQGTIRIEAKEIPAAIVDYLKTKSAAYDDFTIRLE